MSPLQKLKQKPNSQFWGGKIQICCIVRSFYKAVLPLGHLYTVYRAGFQGTFFLPVTDIIRGMLLKVRLIDLYFKNEEEN